VPKDAIGKRAEHVAIVMDGNGRWAKKRGKRSDEEISGLMQLFRNYMAREAERLIGSDVRLRFLGNRDRLPDDILRMMEDLEGRTKDRTKFGLNIALNHGGRDALWPDFTEKMLGDILERFGTRERRYGAAVG